jgi:hypothetical protein
MRHYSYFYQPRLFDANGTHNLHVSQTHQDLLHPVHLQGSHAAFNGSRENLRHTGTLLDQLFDGVIRNQQFEQA